LQGTPARRRQGAVRHRKVPRCILQREKKPQQVVVNKMVVAYGTGLHEGRGETNESPKVRAAKDAKGE